MTNIHNERIKIAKEKKIKYDLRSPIEFYLDERKKNKNLEPKFLYNKEFSDFDVIKKAKGKNSIIPFRGPINKQSVSCAEDLKYRIVENDKYGFKNNNNIYEKNINTILIGDSYAEGICEISKNDIAGNLIKKDINTVNLGITGAGPLLTLAALREFGTFLKPQNVFYLYFEGNDLEDLEFEKKQSYLIKYLNDNHKVNYIKRLEEVKLLLKQAKIESESRLLQAVNNNNISKEINKEKKFIPYIKDIAELSNIKNILRYTMFKKQKEKFDLDLFYTIVDKMNYETKKWNGNFYVVYVPSWSRYFTKFTNKDSGIKLKDQITNNLQKKNINVIDLTIFFNNEKNIKSYFPLGYIGHYNYKGYAKIADLIYENIK